MRIGIVYDALYPFVRGGAERRNHELAARLSASHEVHVVSWRYWDGPAVVVRDGITYHGVGRPPPLYGPDGKRRVSEVLGFSLRVLPVLLRQRFDVVDCSATPYVPLYSAWLASRLTRSRLLVTWHEFWGEHWLEYLPHRPMLARIARAVESGSRRLGDVLVAVSPFTAERMNGAGQYRVSIVGNGIDIGAIRRAEPAPETYDVTFVGRLIDEKRVDLLIDALARLISQRRPSLRCAIVGEGPERAALEERTSRLDIADAVRFMGALPDAETYGLLKSSRLFAMPSAREGFGVAVIEAQACGAVPVVVRSPMSAAGYLLVDGVDGRLCDADAGALACAIDELLTDEPKRLAMAGEARLAAAQRDWAIVSQQMERAYADTAPGQVEPVLVR